MPLPRLQFPLQQSPNSFLILLVAFVGLPFWVVTTEAQTPQLSTRNPTEQALRWEAILDQSFPGKFVESMTTKTLLAQLDELGLPFELTESAEFDSLTWDEEIELRRPNASLRSRLLSALERMNATITLREDRLALISMDDMDDPRYHYTVVYDYSCLPVTEQVLYSSVVNTVVPDSWTDTGQGLATLQLATVHRRQLAIINQTYQAHRAIHQLLEGMNRFPVGGAGVFQARPGISASPSTRTPKHGGISVRRSAPRQSSIGPRSAIPRYFVVMP